MMLGRTVYLMCCAAAVGVAALLIASNVWIGGGLLPDIGALLFGGAIWLSGLGLRSILRRT
jgi:hypothetical protein